MNYVDIILLIVMALAVLGGWMKGFILGSINLIVWIGSLLSGFFFYRYIGNFLKTIFPSFGVWSFPIAFIFIIILARILLTVLFNFILKRTSEKSHRNIFNHILGLIPGAINGIIYATIIAALLVSVPFANKLSGKTSSVIADKLTANVGWIDDKLSPVFSDAVHQSLAKTTVEPEADATVQLNFTVKDALTKPGLEMKMLDLVNAERTKRGLKALEWDAALLPVARAHSQDMFARGYFSHYTPEEKNPFDRMKAAGIKYYSAGENLALGPTLQICHEGLMNSPGHRANILNPSYGRIAIGIADGGAHGIMISQEFRN